MACAQALAGLHEGGPRRLPRLSTSRLVVEDVQDRHATAHDTLLPPNVYEIARCFEKAGHQLRSRGHGRHGMTVAHGFAHGSRRRVTTPWRAIPTSPRPSAAETGLHRSGDEETARGAHLARGLGKEAGRVRDARHRSREPCRRGDAAGFTPSPAHALDARAHVGRQSARDRPCRAAPRRGRPRVRAAREPAGDMPAVVSVVPSVGATPSR
jgi:hypothetical protein